MKKLLLSIVLATTTAQAGWFEPPTSDASQAKQQERILKEGTAQVGMPAIKNFRERKLLKDIYELRDQTGLSTYAYMVATQTGQLVFLCDSVGYPINDATGFTNPEKVAQDNTQSFGTMPQAEPNGLFTPDNSNDHWVMCLNKATNKAVPVFVGTPIIVSPFKF